MTDPQSLPRPSSRVPSEGDSLAPRAFGPDYKIDPASGCWLWQKTVNRAGYGTGSFTSAGLATNYAHRAYYIVANGPVPAGTHIHHRCETPLCVNPAHLEATTPTDHFLGHKLHDKTGLTLEDVKEIRRLATVEGMSAPKVAAQYGIHEITVYDYWSSNHWAELLGGEHAGRPVRTCVACGAEFSERRRHAVYCSQRCQKSYANRQRYIQKAA